MKLYFSRGACSLVVRILINELGLQADYVAVDLKTKKMEDGADYYAINPKGAVPAIEIKPGEYLTENSAIQQYLADANNAQRLLPPVTDFKRYRVLEWLGYMNSEVHKSFSPLFNGSLPQEIKDSIFIPALKKKFDLLNTHLSKQDYLLGNDYMLPDGYLFVMMLWLRNFKIDMAAWPNLVAYYDRLKKRPAVEKSLAEEGINVN